VTNTPPPSTFGPRWLYLHGFASGPASYKGLAISEHYAQRGVAMERLDLRIPSFERLRLGEMIASVRSAIGDEHERAVLFGSSLGGLTACRVAEQDARVCALVLLAPAFRIMERWRERLGEAGWKAWQTTGWLDTLDYISKTMSRVDFGFAEEAAAIDERSGGFPDVRVPTLIIHGVNDPVVDVALSRAWSAGKRHVRLVEVDDGHELAASLDRIKSEADRFLAPFLGG
jgi:uncharacterized protein